MYYALVGFHRWSHCSCHYLTFAGVAILSPVRKSQRHAVLTCILGVLQFSGVNCSIKSLLFLPCKPGCVTLLNHIGWHEFMLLLPYISGCKTPTLDKVFELYSLYLPYKPGCETPLSANPLKRSGCVYLANQGVLHLVLFNYQ